MDHIKILLADDRTLLRAGLGALIDRIENVEVVAEAADALETLRQIEKWKPDIVLMDIALPKANGLEFLTRLGNGFPGVGVIVLAMDESVEYAVQAMQRGAMSCFTGTASHTELEWAIKAVADGQTYILPDTLGETVPALVNESVGEHVTPADLTARQCQVLRLIAEGSSTKRIALALNISAKTVESHRRQIMDRLNIHNIAGLVRFALKHGLVKMD